MVRYKLKRFFVMERGLIIIKPHKLVLKNFISYQNEVIDFTQIKSPTLICGNNGNGKSSLIDAITTAKKLGYKTAKYVADKNTLYIASAVLSGKLVINEVCSTNKTGFVDENNKHSDWIEIYNGTYEDIDLNGLSFFYTLE